MTNPNRIDIVILGAGGNTGKELLHLLQHHPCFRVVHISSDRYAGKKLNEVFPTLSNSSGLEFQSHKESIGKGLPVFLATPDTVSLQLMPKLVEQGHPVVDLSAAFRLPERESESEASEIKPPTKKEVTDKKSDTFDWREAVVYGLPELFRDKISKARVIANPGCYPTSVILPLVALGNLRKRLLSININACSGVSGAGGRIEDAGFSFQGIYENFRAYKILQHQHEPEIEYYASCDLPREQRPSLIFTPHLLPVYRGILTTTVLHWDASAPSALAEKLRTLASKESFLRFYEAPEEIELAKVQNTNYLDVALRSRESVTVMVSALDNLIKGAAGQAIQNMNLMLQIPENTGLED